MLLSFCNLLAMILMPAMILIIYFSLYQSWGFLSASSNWCSSWATCLWTAHIFPSRLHWHRHENALHISFWCYIANQILSIGWVPGWTPLIHTVPFPAELLPPLLFSSEWVIPLLLYHYQWYTEGITASAQLDTNLKMQSVHAIKVDSSNSQLSPFTSLSDTEVIILPFLQCTLY